MKKFILIALAYTGFVATASAFGIKPIVEQPKCYGYHTGTISFTISNGVAPYTYAWSNSLPPTASQSGLGAGSYTVTITDNTGATASYTVVMEQATQIVPTTGASGVTDTNGHNGYIHLTVTGGTPQYSYLWNNGANTQNISGLAAGTYTVTITDAWGCTATASKTVTQPIRPRPGGHTSAHQMSLIEGPKGSDDNNTEKSDITESDKPTDAVAPVSSEEVIAYPNPASNVVSLRSASNTSAQVEILSITGQRVIMARMEGTDASIDVSSLSKGNYILQVKADNGNTTNQLISVIK